MEISLKRIARRNAYTIGHLYIAGQYVCDTLEDTDRALSARMGADWVRKFKVQGRTAIPTGRYRLDLNTPSPRFGGQEYYKRVCAGCPPRVIGVPGFDGILIHAGNTAEDTEGCILVGQNREVGRVLNSRDTLATLMREWLTPAKIGGQEVWITIS